MPMRKEIILVIGSILLTVTKGITKDECDKRGGCLCFYQNNWVCFLRLNETAQYHDEAEEHCDDVKAELLTFTSDRDASLRRFCDGRCWPYPYEVFYQVEGDDSCGLLFIRESKSDYQFHIECNSSSKVNVVCEIPVE
ncbi:UNVERIFIED_CONTAM: hypothetical protein RMT77_008897 [Armadillidium vulgare]